MIVQKKKKCTYPICFSILQYNEKNIDGLKRRSGCFLLNYPVCACKPTHLHD